DDHRAEGHRRAVRRAPPAFLRGAGGGADGGGRARELPQQVQRRPRRREPGVLPRQVVAMKVWRRGLLIAAGVATAACAPVPTGPSVMVLAGPGKTLEQFQA